MTYRSSPALALLLALVTATVAAGQQAGFEDVTDVLVIEVPVQVTKGGQPVRGLSAKDFEVHARGKRQKIVGFQEVDLAEIQGIPSADRIATLPVVARRHFLLLFDLSFARPASVLKAQGAARQLVLEGLHPTDLVGVATYSDSLGAKVILGFTSDRYQIEVALATLGSVDPAERVSDPLGIVMAEYRVQMESGGYAADVASSTPLRASRLEELGVVAPGTLDGEALALAPGAQHLNNMKDQAAMSGRAGRDQVRNQILSLASSFEELAQSLASVDGRKYVVLFSEGFDSTSLLGTEDSGRISDLAKESSFGQFWRVDNDERYGDTGTQQSVFGMLDQFRRCDCTIQAVDIGGVRAGADVQGSTNGEQSLFVMANHTGGELFRNYNDLDEAMAAVLERTSVTYLLAWQPEEVGEPGLFYPIKVKLKGGPKGARVVHRPGYYAPRPYVELDADERRFRTIELLMAGREGGALDASLFTAPFLGSSGQPKVLTMVEIEGYSLLRGHRQNVLPTEVFAYAIDGRGSVVDFMGQAISFDLERVKAALDNRGFKFLGRLDLPPGSYEIRVLVRNVLTGATATRLSSVRVPAFDMGEPALLPPFFIEPDGSWLIGEERRDDSGFDDYPLTIGGRNLIPAARPYLKAASRIPVLLVGYNLASRELRGTGRLEPVTGGEALELELDLERRTDTEIPGVERLAARLATGDAEPGEYRLVVTLSDAAGAAEVSSEIPVRIY